MTFRGTQTVDGTGSILFAGQDNTITLSGSGPPIVTFGEEIAIGGSSGELSAGVNGSSFIVQGTLRAGAGGVIQLKNVDFSAATMAVQIVAPGEGDFGRFQTNDSGDLMLPTTLVIERPTDFVPNAGDRFAIFDAAIGNLIGAIDEIFGDQFDGIRLTPEISDGTLTLLAENL